MLQQLPTGPAFAPPSPCRHCPGYQAYLFAIQPRDAGPDELRIHTASVKVRALQANGEGPPPPNSESITATGVFAELDLSNCAVASFRVRFTVEGETLLGEDKLGFRDDITMLMGPAPSGATVTISLRDGQEILIHKGRPSFRRSARPLTALC